MTDRLTTYLRLALLWLCCAAACEVAAAEPAADAGFAVAVAYPSFVQSPTWDRADMLRSYALREAIILQLKRHGYAVIQESAMPRRQVSYAYISPKRLLSLEGHVVDIQVTPEGTRVDVYVVPEANDDDDEGVPVAQLRSSVSVAVEEMRMLPVATQVARIMAGDEASEVTAPEVTGELDSSTITDGARLDWVFATRLLRYQAMLRALDEGGTDIAIYASLATTAALHGAHYGVSNQTRCMEYMGRALMWAEIVASSKQATATTMAAEIRLLADFWVSGTPIPAADCSMPELAAITRFTGRQDGPLITWSMPAWRSLYDAVINAQVALDCRGHDDQRLRWLQANARNVNAAATVLQTCIDGEEPAEVDRVFAFTDYAMAAGLANNFFVTQLTETWVSPLTIVAEFAVISGAIDEAPGELYELLEENEETMDALDPAGVATFASGSDSVGRWTVVLAAAVANRVAVDMPEYIHELSIGATRNLQMNGHDVYPEFTDRLYALSVFRTNRWWVIAATEREALMRSYQSAFGDRTFYDKRYSDGTVFGVDHVDDWDALIVEWRQLSEAPGPWQRLWEKLPQDLRDADPAIALTVEQRQACFAVLDAFVHDPAPPEPSDYLQVRLGENLTNNLIYRSTYRVDNTRLVLLSAIFPAFIRDRSATSLSTAWQREQDRHKRRAGYLLDRGAWDAAAAVMIASAPGMEQGRDRFDLYKETLYRAGKADEALISLGQIQTGSFGREYLVIRDVLAWRFRDFDDLPEGLVRTSATSNAGVDYQSRAHYALRIGDTETVVEVGQRSHYGQNARDYWTAVGAVMRASASDGSESVSQELLARYLDHARRYLLDTEEIGLADHTLAIFDELLAGNPHWPAVRDELMFPEMAATAAATRALKARPTEATFASVFASQMRFLQGYVAGGPRHMDVAMRAYDQAHEALARLILARTENLARPDAYPEAGDDVRALMLLTHAYYSIHRTPFGNHDVRPVRVLALMVRFGAEPRRVAAFAASLDISPEFFPNAEHRINRGGLPLEFMIARSCAPALAVYFERIYQARYVGSLTIIPYPIVDQFGMFRAARDAGDHQTACMLALHRAFSSEAVDLAAYYLATPAEADAWITANASTATRRRFWHRAWSEMEGSITPVPDVKLPPLDVYLNAYQPVR